MQHTQLDLCYVQPTTMNGSVVPFQLLGDATCFGWGVSLVQHSRMMHIEVVRNEHYHLSLWEVLVHNPSQLLGHIYSCPMLGDFNPPPPSERLAHHEQVGSAAGLVGVIDTLHGSTLRSSGQRHTVGSVCFKEFVALVKAHHRSGRVVGALVHRQHVLHAGYIPGIGFGYAPNLHRPRLKFVFLSILCTWASDMVGTMRNAISRSAKSCIVQRARPSGGWEQASMVR